MRLQNSRPRKPSNTTLLLCVWKVLSPSLYHRTPSTSMQFPLPSSPRTLLALLLLPTSISLIIPHCFFPGESPTLQLTNLHDCKGALREIIAEPGPYIPVHLLGLTREVLVAQKIQSTHTPPQPNEEISDLIDRRRLHEPLPLQPQPAHWRDCAEMVAIGRLYRTNELCKRLRCGYV